MRPCGPPCLPGMMAVGRCGWMPEGFPITAPWPRFTVTRNRNRISVDLAPTHSRDNTHRHPGNRVTARLCEQGSRHPPCVHFQFAGCCMCVYVK